MENVKTMFQDDLRLDAIRAIGWNLDADIPMANLENLKLLKELEEMTQLKYQLTEKINSYNEREKSIQNHKKNLETSINQNMTLYNTMRNDLLKEQHTYKLAHLERCKLNEELRKNRKDYKEYSECKARIEFKLKSSKSEIDNLTKRIKSAKTTLLEWNEAMEDGNKGYQLIEKYYKDDQQRARELNQRRQNLQTEIDRRRRILVEIYEEQNTLEKNLERSASLYRAAHIERRQMVETWKNAVSQMTQRENDIQEGEDLLVSLRETSKDKANEYQKYDKRLNEIVEKNREVEATIEQLNSETSDVKEQIQQLTAQCYLKQREMEMMQKDLANLANRVQLQRTDNRLHQKEKLHKSHEIETFEEVLRKIQERLTAMENKNLNASQRLQILEDMNENEQKSLNDLERESERVNELLYRTQEKITHFKNEVKRLLVNNNAIASTLTSVKRNQKNTQQELQRQTEIHYNMAFKYLEAERRLNILKGSAIDEEVEARNLEILAELEQQSVKLQRRMQQAEAQNKQLNHNMNTMVTAYNNDNKELENIQFKIKEAQVYCEGTIKRLKDRQSNNQELIVELSIMKMRCNDMETEIQKTDKGTLDLEQHRLKIKHAVKNRMIELKSQDEILTLKKKHLNEELSTLRADLGERTKCIEVMRARFELTSKLLGRNDDGTLVTTTQLKVQSAQEKQLLAEQGDELNKKVLKAEQEVIALENTLRQFDKSNEKYRRSFQKDESDEVTDKAADELKQLQLEYCKDLNQLKTLRGKMQRYEYQLQQQRKRQEDLEKSLQLARAKYEENVEIFEKLQKEIDEQNLKIQRAQREIKVALKQIKERPVGSEFLKIFDLDIDLQELEQRNIRALHQLSDMALSDPDGPDIIDLMINKGLRMPQHLKKSRSFFSWKSESSLASTSTAVSKHKHDSLCSGSSGSNSAVEETPSSRISVVSLDFQGFK